MAGRRAQARAGVAIPDVGRTSRGSIRPPLRFTASIGQTPPFRSVYTPTMIHSPPRRRAWPCACRAEGRSMAMTVGSTAGQCVASGSSASDRAVRTDNATAKDVCSATRAEHQLLAPRHDGLRTRSVGGRGRGGAHRLSSTAEAYGVRHIPAWCHLAPRPEQKERVRIKLPFDLPDLPAHSRAMTAVAAATLDQLLGPARAARHRRVQPPGPPRASHGRRLSRPLQHRARECVESLRQTLAREERAHLLRRFF